MSKNQHISTYFFIGIGGIGMSALARYFNTQNKKVLGYDRTTSELTDHLINEDIKVVYSEDEASEIIYKLDKNQTLIVYTPAIQSNSKLLKLAISEDFKIMKRAALLGEITSAKRTLAVAGTHGKTTTSAILAHLLKQANEKVTAFLGGILQSENSNYIHTGNEVIVVEADEFDRSFLHLYPNSAVITSTDTDHLDIYKTKEALQESFAHFSSQVSETLFVAEHVNLKGIKYGFSELAEVCVANLQVKEGSYYFDLIYQDMLLKGLQLKLPGKHNLANAIAALALAIDYNVDKAHLYAAALSSFSGVKRRFNYLFQSEEITLIDDYAHHPTEIEAAYQAVREMHPNENVMVIFQPHLYSRTENFVADFARSLSDFDEICILEIYPAREAPIKGVNAQFLLDKVENKNKKIIEKSDILNSIQQSACSIIIFLGAGDIGEEAQKIKKVFNS